MLQFDLNQCTDIIQRPIRGSRGYHLADRGPYGLGFNESMHWQHTKTYPRLPWLSSRG